MRKNLINVFTLLFTFGVARYGNNYLIKPAHLFTIIHRVWPIVLILIINWKANYFQQFYVLFTTNSKILQDSHLLVVLN